MKKSRFINLILIIILFAGLSLLLYPTVSDHWNSLHQSRAISSYAEYVSAMDEELCEQIWNAAMAYNRDLLKRSNRYVLDENQVAEYERQLNISGNGIMGYVEIPSINCKMPVYHGTAESVLQVAAGHVEWSSLPVGGTNSHCVISGHRGLPSARLFTDLDKLKTGDVFLLHILNRTLTYEVDQVLIVVPQEIDALQIEEEQDYCTLVTCTPYAKNTHRLLVRGCRREQEK